MKRADLIFVLSTLANLWNILQQQVHPLVSEKTFAILGIVFTGVAYVAFAFYEQINGKPQPPVEPPVPPAPSV